MNLAHGIRNDDLARCHNLGLHGAKLIPDKSNVITICNTGGLATSGIGTALGVIQYAHAQGRDVKVHICETRPLLQGARLNTWELVDLETSSGSSWGAVADLKLKKIDGTVHESDTEKRRSSGPIDSVFNAINQITGYNLELINFEIHSVSVGEDAQGEVTVTVNFDGQDYRGHGVSTDIIESGALAYLEVINRIERNKEKH